MSFLRQHRPLALAAALLLASLHTSAAAQNLASAGTIASVVDALARDTSIAMLPDPASCGATDATLCDAAIALRRSDFSQKSSDIAKARTLVDGAATKWQASPFTWYLLAATELAANNVGLPARDGPLQIAANGNAASAERALLHALRLDSTFVLAVEALAIMPISRNGTGYLSARVTALRRARGLLPAPYGLAAANVERAAGHADSAFAIELRLLKNHAAPRGLVDLTIASDLV
ncbi:MAG TPA: hypothetical protein VGM77_13940 [Gemmatimonadales bacterium]